MADEIQPAKSPLQSKTLWLALANAILAFIPPAQKLVAEHPEAYALGLSAVFAVLRMWTKGRVSIV